MLSLLNSTNKKNWSIAGTEKASFLLHERKGQSEKLIVNICATIDEEYYLSAL